MNKPFAERIALMNDMYRLPKHDEKIKKIRVRSSYVALWSYLARPDPEQVFAISSLLARLMRTRNCRDEFSGKPS